MNDAFDRAVQREQDEHRRRKGELVARGNRLGFRIHLTVFVAVQLLLVAIWALIWIFDDESYPWFVFPLLGWGIGLAAHYIVVREMLRR